MEDLTNPVFWNSATPGGAKKAAAAFESDPVNLDLLNCKLLSLPESLATLVPDMERLSCEDNNLDALPNWIFTLSNLRVLNISMNRIREIPSEIRNLTKLEEFRCSYNLIPSITPVMNCLELRLLFCPHTAITEIPREIGNLSHLEALRFNNTLVSVIPVEIERCSNLHYLNCCSSNLKDIPNEFAFLQNLQIFHVTNCPLTDFKGDRNNPLEYIRGLLDGRLTKRAS